MEGGSCGISFSLQARGHPARPPRCTARMRKDVPSGVQAIRSCKKQLDITAPDLSDLIFVRRPPQSADAQSPVLFTFLREHDIFVHFVRIVIPQQLHGYLGKANRRL